ncbi:hypothetical protein FVA81_01325 (plasmid) [Rhizobium sp. WL3]|uniref:hypothetical protein n=1 Tax=Rhizobium sp. WL3 TaxID=2603277 RepID=UPI0011C1F9A0|nr:hypothetical protein [Rhizobium sp. WL3]QEE43316.1 hypothetical protein FVA81_01325 [Rhizobium sp. WL3]
MSTDPETRRSIAQRALDRSITRGIPLKDDEAFMALLEQWIAGEIPMRVMRERYFSAVAQRIRDIADR